MKLDRLYPRTAATSKYRPAAMKIYKILGPFVEIQNSRLLHVKRVLRVVDSLSYRISKRINRVRDERSKLHY